MKIKSLEEATWNYALSSVLGGFKLYLKKIMKGYRIENAQQTAINYAVGQILSSGKASDPSLSLALREIGKFANVLAEIVEQGKKQSKLKQ